MSQLPSYEEATTRPDWLELVVPFVKLSDYRFLCLVNRHFWHVFAPRLWENPLKAVRLAGLDPSDDVSWWFDFVFNKLDAVRAAARSLVRVLDAREFAKESYHFASDRHDRNLQLSFAKALSLFPKVECVLLDGHTDLDLGFLVGHGLEGSQTPPVLLSMADCPFQLPGSFFTSVALNRLVYLDLSAIPGSVRSLLHSGLLPELRILKLRCKELDDATLTLIVKLYGRRLWSLDVSNNHFTDRVVQTLGDHCFPRTVLRTSGAFYTEGKLVSLEGGTPGFGPFVAFQESKWSESFDHPERFYVDSPAYQADAERGLQEYHVSRANGSERLRTDTAEGAMELFSLQQSRQALHAPPVNQGLTHLDISNNVVSSSGLERLLRNSNGQLEYLASDSMPLLPAWTTQRHWISTARLQGTVGTADLFRPVFSSNLRALRLHHSLVSGVLDLNVEGFSSLSRIHLAEKTILPRIQSLYRGAFVPDMNPRLTSLVLTHVPRRSTGPLITSLLNFLGLLSQQERAIQNLASSADSSWRAPDLLRGLRHLRLEFEPDPMEEGFSTAEDLDAEDLMSSGDQGFSFFEGEQYEKTPARARHVREPGPAEIADSVNSDAAGNDPDRSKQDSEEFLTFEGEWESRLFSCQVWLGPKSSEPGTALHRYRQLVQVQGVRDGVGPASPAQLRIGAPKGSFIFHTAWNLAIMPLQLEAPSRNELAVMQDVVEALKRYRVAGRAKYTELKQRAVTKPVPLGEPHSFWTGRLEVSTQQPLPQGRASQYWR